MKELELAGRALHYTFEALDVNCAIGLPPDGERSGTEWNHICQVRDAVRAADDTLATARADKNLSAEGAAERAKPKVVAAAAVIERATDRFVQQAKDIEAQRQKLSAIPEADPAQHGLEREIRERVLAMQPKDRDALYERLGRGENDEVLWALMRDPLIEKRERDVLNSLWEPRVQAKHRAQLAALDAAEERNEWARSSIESFGVALKGYAERPLVTMPRKWGAA